MWRGRPAWAEIDLDEIEHNLRQIRLIIGNRVKLMAVVKANGYGHGAVPVARAAIEAGANGLAVACVEEGAQLREAGINAPVLVLGYVPPWQTEQAVVSDLAVTVYTWQSALALSSRASALGVEANVHVKVDTGLGRNGLLPDEVLEFVRGIKALPHLRVEGLWTHFATADERDKSYTQRQFRVFETVLGVLSDAGISIPCRHAANSAAALEMPQTHLDMVRCGIAMYGLYPSVEAGQGVALHPVMSVKARAVRVKELPSGSSVSYGRKFIADGPTRIALVPFGYADGFLRCLSSTGSVLIGGERAVVAGRVCMDQFAVNVTGIEGVNQDAEVVLIGQQGRERITADEVALAAGTINYEVVCGVSARVPRVYIRNGKPIEFTSLVDGGPID